MNLAAAHYDSILLLDAVIYAQGSVVSDVFLVVQGEVHLSQSVQVTMLLLPWRFINSRSQFYLIYRIKTSRLAYLSALLELVASLVVSYR